MSPSQTPPQTPDPTHNLSRALPTLWKSPPDLCPADFSVSITVFRPFCLPWCCPLNPTSQPVFEPRKACGLLPQPGGLLLPTQNQCTGQRAVGVSATLGARPQSCPQVHSPWALTQGSLGQSQGSLSCSQLPLASGHSLLCLGPSSQMEPPRQDGGHG